MRNAIYCALAAYYTINGKKVHKEQEKNTCKSVTMPEKPRAKDTVCIYTKTEVPPREPPFWKGKRMQSISNFRGYYANRGNGMELCSSDVSNLYAKDTVCIYTKTEVPP